VIRIVLVDMRNQPGTVPEFNRMIAGQEFRHVERFKVIVARAFPVTDDVVFFVQNVKAVTAHDTASRGSLERERGLSDWQVFRSLGRQCPFIGSNLAISKPTTLYGSVPNRK
jgi:hypothetical protein